MTTPPSPQPLILEPAQWMGSLVKCDDHDSCAVISVPRLMLHSPIAIVRVLLHSNHEDNLLVVIQGKLWASRLVKPGRIIQLSPLRGGRSLQIPSGVVLNGLADIDGRVPVPQAA